MCRNNRELRDINMVETVLKDQGSKFVNCAFVTSVGDTRAIGRIELYSKHEEPQVVRIERVLNTHCGLPRPLAG